MKKSSRIITAIAALSLILCLFSCNDTPAPSSGATDSNNDVFYTLSDDDNAINPGADESKSATGDGADTDSNGDKKPGNSKKTPSAANSGTQNTPRPIIDDDVVIRDGRTPLESGLNFGGKTFKMAISADKIPTHSDLQMIKAFESAYKCTLKYDIINFNDMLKKVSEKMVGGAPYDIVYLHGSMFPTAVINRVLAPIDDQITKADLYSASKSSAGGIDLDRSKYFAWDNKLYALSGNKDVNIYLIYYNKQKFEDEGLSDPLALYNQGKWTWDEFIKMGKLVTNARNGKYFADGSFVSTAIPFSYGGQYLKIVNKVPTVNFDDQKLRNGLNFLKRLTHGAEQIVDIDGAGAGDDPRAFLGGNSYVFLAEDLAYKRFIVPGVKNGSLGGKLSNVGFVPVPLASGNKSYPAGWVLGTAAGKGSSTPLAAAAWAKFKTTWKNPNTPEDDFPSNINQILDKLRGNLNILNYGYGGSGDDNCITLISKLTWEVTHGSDVATVLNQYKNMMQNAVNVTMRN